MGIKKIKKNEYLLTILILNNLYLYTKKNLRLICRASAASSENLFQKFSEWRASDPEPGIAGTEIKCFLCKKKCNGENRMPSKKWKTIIHHLKLIQDPILQHGKQDSGQRKFLRKRWRQMQLHRKSSWLRSCFPEHIQLQGLL